MNDGKKRKVGQFVLKKEVSIDSHDDRRIGNSQSKQQIIPLRNQSACQKFKESYPLPDFADLETAHRGKEANRLLALMYLSTNVLRHIHLNRGLFIRILFIHYCCLDF